MWAVGWAPGNCLRAGFHTSCSLILDASENTAAFMNYSNVSFTYTPENMTAILKDFLSSYSNGFHHSIKKIV